MNPGVEKGYALDYISVVRHVAHELGRVAPVALPLTELAQTYHHIVRADLTRVKLHHGLTTEGEAERFLLQRAVEDLVEAGQVKEDIGGYSLAVPFELMEYEGRSLSEVEKDVHAKFRDPFNPQSGEFAENIREGGYTRPTDDDTDLEESMKAFGWIPELPAIRDERGVVLVGHRRMVVAAKLGIEPVIKDIVVGKGDEADARRLAIAIASNVGSKILTRNERKRIAEYLYGEQAWTMERIGKALGVGKSTIARDLEDFSHGGKKDRVEKRGRPKKVVTDEIPSAPRTTSKASTPTTIPKPPTPTPPASLPPALAAKLPRRRRLPASTPPLPVEQERRVGELMEQGAGREEIQQELGLGKWQVEMAMERERGRQEVLAELKVCPECGRPITTTSTPSSSTS